MERRLAYGGLVAGAGVVLAVVQVVQAIQETSGPVVTALDAVPMVAVALALSFTGAWLARTGAHERDLLRIVAWSVGGSVAFLSFAALALFGQNVATGDLSRAQYVAVDNVTIGATSGLLVGLYDARSRERRRALRSERDRVEAFAQKAADLNNYGRAIAGCDAVAGVSAFCIESVSSLLGIRETAFAEVVGDSMHVVGDTTVGVDRNELRALVDVALEQEVGSVVVHEELPAALERTDGTALTVYVTERADSSVVMVSLTDATDPVEDEDRQLLELLVSHAGSTLDRIDAVDYRA